MNKMRNPLVMNSLTLPRGISIVFRPDMGCQSDEGIENLETDLLLLTQMEGAHLSWGCRKIDEQVKNEISSEIAKTGFQGREGEHLLFDLSKHEGAKQRYILLVGLGNYKHFNGRVVCKLTRLALETAARLSVSKLTFAVFPSRQSAGKINLAGSAAIIACRVSTFAAQLPALEEIEFFCTPQARRHLQDGLMAKIPHCQACSNPAFEVKS